MRRIDATVAVLLATVAIPLLAPGASQASTIRDLPGCTDAQLPAGDDISSAPVPIGFTINFAYPTSSHPLRFDSLHVNNNGSVTFGQPGPSFPAWAWNIIAPYSSDVDTRTAGTVTYGQTTFNGETAFCVIWNGVGHYNAQADHPNTFQLLLIDRPDAGPGAFVAEFNYEPIQWEGIGKSTPGSGYPWMGFHDAAFTFGSMAWGGPHGGFGTLTRWLAGRFYRVEQTYFCGNCAPLPPSGPRPLIVVPGTTGTFLQNPSGEVWPNAAQLTLPLNHDTFLDALQLGDDGLPSPDPSHAISIETSSRLRRCGGQRCVAAIHAAPLRRDEERARGARLPLRRDADGGDDALLLPLRLAAQLGLQRRQAA